MKKILCIISEKFPAERKTHIIECLRSHAKALHLPFKIDLFSQEPSDQSQKKIDINEQYKNHHYVIALFPPKNVISQLPFAEIVLSLNSGVDDIIHEVKPTTKLTRIVHQPAINRMKEYVLYCIIDYTLLMDKHRANQHIQLWDRSKPFSVQNDNIGIMGFGNVGQRLTEVLIGLGKNVRVYSKSKKETVIQSFACNEIHEFLSTTNILINALPLNEETQGILNKHTLNSLPDNSCIINVGRGGHIIEDDLLDALSSGKLSKVYLDVFDIEPLPKEHSYWSHEKIFITPHISGVFDVADVLEPAIKQLKVFYENGIAINSIQH